MLPKLAISVSASFLSVSISNHRFTDRTYQILSPSISRFILSLEYRTIYILRKGNQKNNLYVKTCNTFLVPKSNKSLSVYGFTCRESRSNFSQLGRSSDRNPVIFGIVD
ncbi:hypothetical protein NE237_012686 [Protea cynaroides]|uniref:Uncharacterized protein n=1 Tax=Protea cynaroides TaxID=273540 RepID=A0A9Q0GXY2_9MAGN|nr:hypothetical protein NE237_012686 [Protea cynaroides]